MNLQTKEIQWWPYWICNEYIITYKLQAQVPQLKAVAAIQCVRLDVITAGYDMSSSPSTLKSYLTQYVFGHNSSGVDILEIRTYMAHGRGQFLELDCLNSALPILSIVLNLY